MHKHVRQVVIQTANMVSKITVIAFLCCVAYAAGTFVDNPAVGVQWRWRSPQPTVSTNTHALPLAKFLHTYEPIVRIAGTKKVASCGAVKAKSRIVGGTEVTPHAYPWQVALFIGQFFCGGSIISDQWVLTAAHCMTNAKVVIVLAGAHSLVQPEPGQIAQVSREFIVHERWMPNIVRNDVALVKVPTPYTFNDNISPVCLPSYSAVDLIEGDTVTATGWGMTSDDLPPTQSLVLMEVTVPVASQEFCKSVFGFTITENVVCIDTTGAHGTCQGDSGGPLLLVSGDVSYTRGITSFGSSNGCTLGDPAAFTRVSHYLDWIETQTGIAINP